MSVVIKQRRLARLPTAPNARVNSAHFAAPSLEFAYLGHPAVLPRNRALRGREEMTAVSGTTYGVSADGWGVYTDAATRGYYTVARNPSAFAGDITLLWRGVILGAPGATNFGRLFGIAYNGTGSSSPFEVFGLQRDNSNADNLAVIINDGSTFRISSSNVGLTSFYGQPITIAVSQVATSTSIIGAIRTPGGVIRPAMNNFANAGARLTSSGDRIYIGDELGAGRFPNAICTAAALWSRALPIEQLLTLVANNEDIFEGHRVVVPFDVGAPPPPPPPPGSGYLPIFKTTRPSLNIGLRMRG